MTVIKLELNLRSLTRYLLTDFHYLLQKMAFRNTVVIISPVVQLFWTVSKDSRWSLTTLLPFSPKQYFLNGFYAIMSVLTVMLSFWFWCKPIFFSFSNTVRLQQFKYDCRLSNFYYCISNFTLKGVACLHLDRAVAVLSSRACLLTHSPFQKCFFCPHVNIPDVERNISACDWW